MVDLDVVCGVVVQVNFKMDAWSLINLHAHYFWFAVSFRLYTCTINSSQYMYNCVIV